MAIMVVAPTFRQDLLSKLRVCGSCERGEKKKKGWKQRKIHSSIKTIKIFIRLKIS